jgi:hypothetical protein
MAEHTCTARIEPAEEGGHDVFVPALPGCVTQGETSAEAVAMATSRRSPMWLRVRREGWELNPSGGIPGIVGQVLTAGIHLD